MSQPEYSSYEMINRDLSFDEIEKMTRNLKSHKSCGFDKIPNDIQKRPEIHILLCNMHNLFLTMES